MQLALKITTCRKKIKVITIPLPHPTAVQPYISKYVLCAF